MMRKFNPENWERLLSEERRALLNPGSFLDSIGVESGSVAADLGAGPGFFTLPLAQRVGPRGTVYAVDISPEMVRLLRDQDLPGQVKVLLSGETRLPLPDAAVDLALLAFVLHELEKPTGFLGEVQRILKPSARLVVLEWVPQEEVLGPPVHERIPEEESAQILASSGLRVSTRGIGQRFELLPGRAPGRCVTCFPRGAHERLDHHEPGNGELSILLHAEPGRPQSNRRSAEVREVRQADPAGPADHGI
jgi:SAM-dependent methyltransferase